MANASSIFQNMMNKILRDLIDQEVVVYIDDILIYLAEKKEHERLVIEVLQCVDQWNLAVPIDICKFHKETVEFLGYITSRDSIAISKDQVELIRD
jgi:hypothetical protein